MRVGERELGWSQVGAQKPERVERTEISIGRVIINPDADRCYAAWTVTYAAPGHADADDVNEYKMLAPRRVHSVRNGDGWWEDPPDDAWLNKNEKKDERTYVVRNPTCDLAVRRGCNTASLKRLGRCQKTAQTQKAFDSCRRFVRRCGRTRAP